MAFACIYIPNFIVQSVVRAAPPLRDCALAVITGAPPLWNVAAANAAAFRAGIQLGMTKAQVEQFAGVQICQRSESQEKVAHAALLDVGWSISPRVEDTADDTVILDLDGLASLFGDDEKIARELEKRVASIGLAPHIGVAPGIDVAILAARGFTGITIISPGEERNRLGGLPIQTLATNAEILEILERWGIETLEALAALPVLQLSERLGQEGVRLHQLARGVCVRSLALAQPSSQFTEEMELDDAVEELEPLSFLLGRLLDQLCARMQARALAIRAVHVHFELEPSFEKDVQSLKDDSRKKTAPKQYAKVLSLPVPVRDSKTLLKLLRLQLQSDPPKSPIQKIMLTADAAAPRVAQGGLFAPPAPDPEKLELTIARLAQLVGDANVGSPELVDTHRDENFRVRRFAAVRENAKPRQKNGKPLPMEVKERTPVAGFRAMRPSLPVRVEVRDEQPARVCVEGTYGNVMAASGPWRSSGDWWQEDSWSQDEWDVAIDFARVARRPAKHTAAWPAYAVYRIYYDTLRRAWFLRGLYD